MKEYEQDYYFENNNDTSKLQSNEKKTVSRCFTVWLVCAIISFAIPIVAALISFIVLGFNPLAVFGAYIEIKDTLGIVGYFSPLIIATISIVQHVLAIVNRIKYPLNEKADTMFRADMIILAISVALIVIGIVSVGIFCNSCLNEMEECG